MTQEETASPGTDRADAGTVVAEHLVDVPDFPTPGVVFKDITPLLQDGPAFRTVVRAMAERYRGRVDAVAGIESRGFVFGAALAYELGVGLVLIRKAGKLPRDRHSISYELEYGSATVEVHQDAFTHADRVLLVDDVLATGGTAAAAADLVETAGGVVADIAVIVELGFLDGRAALPGRSVWALHTV
ncbi:adenine phosphoribosyltransferase [Nostocoides sp. F2B08]|uniref:adenine phosphoribosyltransferase n=1 Tax=Nostocoides sp. F2B08 TaxID=2653936 RepID=UPI0012632290|nr:adenine phosphoribosyltransferase [Tetrasphaera sp. F2B08]KAB7743054.1 adenine phosphoribosyltransferase [Tetrasphaera sp. F2B08]